MTEFDFMYYINRKNIRTCLKILIFVINFSVSYVLPHMIFHRFRELLPQHLGPFSPLFLLYFGCSQILFIWAVEKFSARKFHVIVNNDYMDISNGKKIIFYPNIKYLRLEVIEEALLFKWDRYSSGVYIDPEKGGLTEMAIVKSRAGVREYYKLSLQCDNNKKVIMFHEDEIQCPLNKDRELMLSFHKELAKRCKKSN